MGIANIELENLEKRYYDNIHIVNKLYHGIGQYAMNCNSIVKISRMVYTPPVLEPDHDLSLGQPQVFSQLGSLLLTQEGLLSEAGLQLSDLVPSEHSPSGGPRGGPSPPVGPLRPLGTRGIRVVGRGDLGPHLGHGPSLLGLGGGVIVSGICGYKKSRLLGSIYCYLRMCMRTDMYVSLRYLKKCFT